MKVYKKYLNRKLYDTVQSRYVTLKNNVQFMIIDNESKLDITCRILKTILLEYGNVEEGLLLDLIIECT